MKLPRIITPLKRRAPLRERPRNTTIQGSSFGTAQQRATFSHHRTSDRLRRRGVK